MWSGRITRIRSTWGVGNRYGRKNASVRSNPRRTQRFAIDSRGNSVLGSGSGKRVSTASIPMIPCCSARSFGGGGRAGRPGKARRARALKTASALWWSFSAGQQARVKRQTPLDGERVQKVGDHLALQSARA